MLWILMGCPGDAGNNPTTDSDSSVDTHTIDPDVVYSPLLPNSLWITASASEVMADGLSSLTLTVEAQNHAGEPVEDGTKIPIEASLGTITNVSPSENGVVTARYTAGTWPGEASFSAEGWSLGSSDTITLVQGTSLSAQMHIHGSLSEGNGGMASHTEQAEETRVDLLWWTDHDYLYYPERFLEINGESFDDCTTEREIQTWPSTESRLITWELYTSNVDDSIMEVTEEAAMEGDCGARISVTASHGSYQQLSIYAISVTPNFTFKSLLGDVTLSFSFRPANNPPHAELFIDVPLSETLAGDETGSARQIRFYHSETEYKGSKAGNTVYIRLEGEPEEWTTVSYNITELAKEHYGDAAVDLHAEFIRVGVASSDEKKSSFDLDSFHWEQTHVGEKLRQKQESYLETLPPPTRHLIGQELSLFGHLHFNAFGRDVPFLPYWEGDFWNGNETTEYVREHGGLTACAHMFGVGIGTEEDDVRAEMISTVIDEYRLTEAYGCDLIEVGYRARVGALADFLTVWDTMSAEGVYMTGLGVSDIHNQNDWATYINNFVTWIRTASDDETDLLWGLQRGVAWFGDSNYFPDGVEVTLQAPEHRATMGQIIVGAGKGTTIDLGISTLPEGAVVSLVDDGTILQSWTIKKGPFSESVAVDPTGGAIYRIEVLAEDETEILYSNPLIFLDEDPGTLPPERIPAP